MRFFLQNVRQQRSLRELRQRNSRDRAGHEGRRLGVSPEMFHLQQVRRSARVRRQVSFATKYVFTSFSQADLHIFDLCLTCCDALRDFCWECYRYYLLSGSPVCETDWHKIVKSSSLTAAAAATGNSGTPVRKGKVGRPRRSRE